MIGIKGVLGAMLAMPLFAVEAPVPVHVVRGDDSALSVVRGVTMLHGTAFTGEIVTRDEDGRSVTVRLIEGRREGFSEARYPGGQVAYRRRYHRGRESGAHDGWWPDGRPRFRYRYRDGLADGAAEEWFPNGQRARVAHYRAGQEEGAQQSWFADGTLRANYVTRNGRRYGLPGTKGCFGHDSIRVAA